MGGTRLVRQGEQQGAGRLFENANQWVETSDAEKLGVARNVCHEVPNRLTVR